MGKAINADISHGCLVLILPQVAGHTPQLVGLQGRSMCERGLLEATLPQGLAVGVTLGGLHLSFCLQPGPWQSASTRLIPL